MRPHRFLNPQKINSESPKMPSQMPEAIEQLCLEHDRVCEFVNERTDSLLAQCGTVVDKESAQEFAGSLEEIANDLNELLTEKDAAGYFAGSEDAEQHARERAVHLRADQRRLISDVRSVAREFRSGKASKARRQLSTWVSKFQDANERDSRHIAELWSAE